MKIIILRHGRPDISKKMIVTGQQFGTWIKEYNFARLDLNILPSDELYRLAVSCNTTICSNLSRSIESAKVLGKENFKVDESFIEADLPFYNISFFKLKAKTWLVVFRVLWLLGFAKNVESFYDFKYRANLCTDKLCDTATNGETVLFVGHGILNRMIAKKLIALGWRGPKKISSNYWSYAIYEF